MIINKVSKIWSFTPKQGELWDVQFFPVEDCKQTSFVIVILVAGMKNLGVIFTKCPKSFELQNPSGSDGGEEMVSLDFSQWKERMLRSACRVESKGEYIFCQGYHLMHLPLHILPKTCLLILT